MAQRFDLSEKLFGVKDVLPKYSKSTPAPTKNYTPAPQMTTRPTVSNTSSAGNVAGASTSRPSSQQIVSSSNNKSNSSSNDNGIDEARDDSEQRERELRNAINAGYDSYATGLQGLQAGLEKSRDEELGSTNKTYEQIFGGLDEEKATNLSKLDANRKAVEARKAQSIKDLQQNLSNTMRASSMQFGAMGAGDTSATRVMLPYAYTKLAGVQEGGIARQASDQMFDIDQQEKDTQLEYSKMWRQTEVDKESRLSEVTSYYSDAIRNIQAAIVQAPADKARDLAALSSQLLQEAQTNLRQLEAEDRQRKENVKSWASNRMSELNNLRLTLAGNANFSPEEILWSELPTLNGGAGASAQESFYNPMLLASKRRQDYLAG